MAIDRAKFFEGIRQGPFPGSLAATTVQGCNAILDEWERRGLTDLRWLAYMLATVLAECGRDMLPVREGFKATDALARAYVRGRGYKYAAVVNGQVYYGRGLVQLTWATNYKAMSKIIGIDLENQPDAALSPAVASKIMFEGMIRGTFTGKKLADYFTGGTADWTNARRIINGLDRAAEIAGYGKQFHADLVAADKPTLTDIAKKAARDAGIAGGATGAAQTTEKTVTVPVDVPVPYVEILIWVAVIAALVFAASFAWRWWKARQEQATAEAQEVAAREFDSDEADAAAVTNADADAIATTIANKAKGAVASHGAVAEAMASPKDAPKKPKRKAAKRVAKKKRKAA